MNLLMRSITSILLLLTPAIATIAQEPPTLQPYVLITIQVDKELKAKAIGCVYYNQNGEQSSYVIVPINPTATTDQVFENVKFPMLGPSSIVQGSNLKNILSCQYSSGDATQHINCTNVQPSSNSVDLRACMQAQTRSPELEKGNL